MINPIERLQKIIDKKQKEKNLKKNLKKKLKAFKSKEEGKGKFLDLEA